MVNGILVNDATFAEIQKLCEELGIEGLVAS
jgi:hypothetical protein